jgi:hypothetical protein
MSYRVKSLAWGLVFLLYAGGAWGEPSASDRATARVLADEAGDALDKKNYEVAADRFARADALVHAPTLLLGLARAQAGLHKFVEAQENYQRILREGVPAGAPPAFAKALQDAQRELKTVTSKLAWVTVTVKEPATSVVTIDGTELPRAALDVKRAVNPGSHVLQATAEGYNSGTVNIDVAEGEAKAVALTLEPKSGSAARPSTTLGSETSPTSPISPVGADTAQPASSRQKTFGFIGLGVGAAGLAVGGVAGLIAMSRHSALETDCQSGKCPASAQSTLDGFRTMATVSTVGFIVGGVAAATGGALLLTAPRAQTGRVEPYIGLAYVGARIRF